MTAADRLNRLVLAIGVYEWRWLRALFVVVLRIVRSSAGDARAIHILYTLADRLAWSGWPFARGWANLHASRFAAVVGHSVWGRAPVAVRPITAGRHRRLRIAMVAHFHMTLGTQRPLFEQVPDEIIELHLIDRRAGSGGAPYLAPLAASYAAITDETPDAYAAAINRVAPDLLLNVVPRPVMYRTFEAIDTPCIAHVCTGSDLMHHPRVAYHLFTQPEFGYGVRAGEVHCHFTDRPFGNVRAYDSWLVCDARGFDRERPPWRDREPLIVWHGSLYKLSAPCLDAIFNIMQVSRDVRFEFFGRGPSLSEILRRASVRGLADRVTHRGVAGFVRDERGELQPETFADLRDSLARARFWPDSFPIGGGSARFEAYAAGVPSIHMAPTADPPARPYEHGSLLELPWLAAQGSVARSREDYETFGMRCLTDEAFAESLVRSQDTVVASVLDGRAWWRHMYSCYEDWQRWSQA